METQLEQIYSAVIEGDKGNVESGVQSALEAGIKPEVILQQSLIPAMSEVGKRFEAGDYFVPEMLIAARAMQTGLKILKPLLVASEIKPVGRVVIGTVKGDLHDIGKNLVAMMLEGAGFEIFDLGTDVSADAFVNAVRQHNPQIVGLSALLTTTMPGMKTTIDAIKEAGLGENVKVIIGGAPVTEAFSKEIGADGYAADASQAASLAVKLIG